MQNKVPKKRATLGKLGEFVKMGLAALGVILGITQITTAGFGALLTAFNNALAAYNTARGNRQAASNLCKSTQKELQDWLKVVRGIFIGDFGTQWSEQWASAGYVEPSTATPTDLGGQLSLAFQLGKFFTANPDFEVPEKNVTAAQAVALRQAVLDAQEPLKTADVALKAAAENLNTAQAALTGNIRFLIKILTGTLGKNDPRWEAFGLNIPGINATPGATGLSATITGNKIALECDATPLATRYRFRGKIVGQDPKYKLLGSSTAPVVMLEGIAAGLTLEIVVQAVNGSSQGVASPTILVTMPPAAKPEPASADSEMAPLVAITTNGNGSHAVNRLS